MTRMPTVLVTGATGRVGAAVLAALRGRARAVGATRDPARTRGSGADGAEWRRLDLADPATHAAALAGVEAVFLMRPPAMARARAFAPFLDAVEAAGLRRLVLLSVRGADRIPVLPHHGIERLARARLPEATILRPADFMQNLETVHRAEVARGEIVAPAGTGRSAFVDVADVGAAAAAALLGEGHEGRAYDLSGPEALSFDEVAAILAEALGRPVSYRSPALPAFVSERVRGGTPLPMALVMAALYTAQRLGAAEAVTADLPALLGRPATPFADYARRARAVWAA